MTTERQGNAYGMCAHCGRVMYVKLDGLMRLHRDKQGHPCRGGNRRPLRLEA